MEYKSYGFSTEEIDNAEAKMYLSTYISAVTKQALAMIREESKKEPEGLLRQIQLCNEIIDHLEDEEFQQDFQDYFDKLLLPV